MTIQSNWLFSINSSQFTTNFGIFWTCQKAAKQWILFMNRVEATRNVIPYSVMEFASNKKKAKVEMKPWLLQIKISQFRNVIGYRVWFGCGGWMPIIWKYFRMNWNNLIEPPAILIVDNNLTRRSISSRFVPTVHQSANKVRFI